MTSLPTKSPAAAILCLSSLLTSLAGAESIYSVDTTLSSDATLGGAYVINNATLTIQSGTIHSSFVGVAAEAVPGGGDLGHVVVNGGNFYSSTSIYLAYGSNSVADFEINGGTVITPTIDVGFRGRASLHMTGGILNTSTAFIGGMPNTFAQLDGGTWTNGGTLTIGQNASGILYVNNGALNTSTLIMGYAGRQSQITQNGGLLNVDNFYFGNSQEVVSAAINGGTFHATTARIGYGGASGVINVKAGAVLSIGQALLYSINAGIYLEGGTLRAARHEPDWMAGFVPGSLILQTDGGTVDTQAFNVGLPAPITGTGSLTKTGTGTLTLSAANTYTGHTNINAGTLTVAAGGAISAPTSGIIVANTGTGSFVMNGGSVTVDSLVIGHDGGTATVALNGGTLTTNEIARWSVPSTIAFNGGTLRAAGHTSVLLNGFTSGSAVIQAGGLTIDTNGYTVSTAAELTGNGTLTKTGGGTLSLAGAYAHTGTTAVHGGTLRLTSARLADAASVSIATGATLQLDFTGTDTIGSLTLGGVTHISGTWGAPGSGAQHETPLLSGPGRLTVVNELSSWLTANGHPGATAGGDEDHDGLTNLDEYFSGSLPGQPNATTTTTSHAPGIIEITFDRRKGLQTVGAVVEWSADLTAWSSDGVSAPQVIADQGTTERLRVTVPNPTTATRRFVRVRSAQE